MRQDYQSGGNCPHGRGERRPAERCRSGGGRRVGNSFLAAVLGRQWTSTNGWILLITGIIVRMTGGC